MMKAPEQPVTAQYGEVCLGLSLERLEPAELAIGELHVASVASLGAIKLLLAYAGPPTAACCF